MAAARWQAVPVVVPFGPDAPPPKPPVASGIRALPSAVTLFGGALALLCVAGFVALGAEQTLLFPSLGPTAMLFFARPLPPECTVRNVIVGHWVGILTGLVMLEIFGLRSLPSAVTHGLGATRVVAAALSVALTATILRLIRSPHAPAGASTLIVSLGLLTTDKQLGMMGASVVLVAVAGWGLNLVTGVRVPLWRKPGGRPPSDVGEVIPPPWYPARPAQPLSPGSPTPPR
jgi:CBS-domain-containing membrane protein